MAVVDVYLTPGARGAHVTNLMTENSFIPARACSGQSAGHGQNFECPTGQQVR